MKSSDFCLSLGYWLAEEAYLFMTRTTSFPSHLTSMGMIFWWWSDKRTNGIMFMWKDSEKKKNKKLKRLKRSTSEELQKKISSMQQIYRGVRIRSKSECLLFHTQFTLYPLTLIPSTSPSSTSGWLAEWLLIIIFDLLWYDGGACRNISVNY